MIQGSGLEPGDQCLGYQGSGFRVGASQKGSFNFWFAQDFSYSWHIFLTMRTSCNKLWGEVKVRGRASGSDSREAKEQGAQHGFRFVETRNPKRFRVVPRK